MKSRTWALLFVGLFAVLAVIALLGRGGSGAPAAEVYSDGELIMTLDLSRDETYTIRSQNGGSNTLEVRDGCVYVTEADCPDGVCVRHGAAKAGSPIVCLPNRLVISLRTDRETEAADVTVG